MSDDLKTGACGMWRVIILAMAGLTAMVAHAQTPASDPKRPGYTVQQQGNITNILVVDPDLQKQAALFQAVRAQPATEDDVIVQIGRAACRERRCHSVQILVVAVLLQKKTQ